MGFLSVEEHELFKDFATVAGHEPEHERKARRIPARDLHPTGERLAGFTALRIPGCLDLAGRNPIRTYFCE